MLTVRLLPAVEFAAVIAFVFIAVVAVGRASRFGSAGRWVAAAFVALALASADATPRRGQQLRQDGAFDYLTKPLDMTRFLDVVDAALAGRPERTRPPA